MYAYTAKQRSKLEHQSMSGSSTKAKELSTKEDKIIRSTIFLLEGNKLKLDVVNKLNKVNLTIQGLALDDNMKLDMIQSMNSVLSSIKQSYEKKSC